jgi:hypothetical protein
MRGSNRWRAFEERRGKKRSAPEGGGGTRRWRREQAMRKAASGSERPTHVQGRKTERRKTKSGE